MARRSNSNRRQFAWYRSQGGQELQAAEGNLYGSVDLLAQVRDQYGQDVGAGSTLVAVKGFIKPNTGGGVANPTNLAGAFGMRVCTREATLDPTVAQSPINDVSQEVGWFYFNPYMISIQGTWDVEVASSALGGSPWYVDAQASRRIPQLGDTVGLFAGLYGEPAGTTVYFDWHLSVGVKLP